MHPLNKLCLGLSVIVVVAAATSIRPVQAAFGENTRSGEIAIAAAVCLTGSEAAFGRDALEGLQLALDEANARGDGPRLTLTAYDEQSDVAAAKRAARRIAASPAVFVLGSAFSVYALVEAPIFARAGLATLATASSDAITRNATTFRVLFRTSEQGELLANYVSRVLGVHRAAVIVQDDGYGRPLRDGFAAAAARLGLAAQYYAFTSLAQARQAARRVAADRRPQAAVLLTLDGPGAPIVVDLRRAGFRSAILGANAFSEGAFRERLAREPEEQRRPGALTDNLYAISAMLLDSAGAQTLAFADRFRARYHHDPSSAATEWYDLGTLSAAGARAVSATRTTGIPAMRAAAFRSFESLDRPSAAVAGLLGPIWFDANRGRTQALRIGRYSGGQLESAPLQIEPVVKPAAAELAAGEVFATAPGRWARLQRVVYTGVYLNGISHIDLPRSSFGADFYVWLRFAKHAGRGSIDPADITFPNMLSGSFDPARPAEQGEMPDGTAYRLWRVQGEFRNDFDLHAFPFDRQRLALPFFNARGASDRIVYVLDRRTLAVGTGAADPGAQEHPPIASPTAFSELTQWDELGGIERRDNLVTYSSLGDPRSTDAGGYRELAGFVATFDVKRRALSTVIKTLMPLLLMTLIIYTTLFFPAVLIKEKVTVAVTGALSGAVLLTAINSQLGAVGYTIAIEYVFFVFFGLTTFTIVAALAAQQLRHDKRNGLAVATERGTQVVFALAVLLVLAGAWWMSAAAGVEP
jgi:ABC-type branched-subunit amino acid transport system substrate-binding protein